MKHHDPVSIGLEQALAFEEQPHPGLDEVMQRPESPCAVPVEHLGPVQVHQLPAKLGTAFAVTASSTPQQILGADRFRKVARLISTDNPFGVSVSRSVNGTQTGAVWPANVPLILEHSDAITVYTASGTASVSVITENWTR